LSIFFSFFPENAGRGGEEHESAPNFPAGKQQESYEASAPLHEHSSGKAELSRIVLSIFSSGSNCIKHARHFRIFVDDVSLSYYFTVMSG